jgi:putative phosphoribosyl transferase
MQSRGSPASATHTTRELAFETASGVIAGTLVLPRDAVGLVLFAHGSGSSRFSSRNIFVADVLNEGNIGTLLLDLLTSQEASEDEFTARYRFNIPMLASRLLLATEECSKRPELEQLPYGYFGASTGAAAALIAAADGSVPIAAVVSRGGRPDLADEALARVKAPTLLIVGGNDDIVLELYRLALTQLRGLKALDVISGATHLFEEPGTLERAATLAREWFLRYMRPQEGKT